jgi:hypothetical protein
VLVNRLPSRRWDSASMLPVVLRKNATSNTTIFASWNTREQLSYPVHSTVRLSMHSIRSKPIALLTKRARVSSCSVMPGRFGLPLERGKGNGDIPRHRTVLRRSPILLLKYVDPHAHVHRADDGSSRRTFLPPQRCPIAPVFSLVKCFTWTDIFN